MPVFKEVTIMAKQKHLTLDDRYVIQQMLENRESFKEIGRKLDKDCTTISKEIKNHIVFQKKGFHGHAFNDCTNRHNCTMKNICSKPGCTFKNCRFCPICHINCEHYTKETCNKLSKPPYVCNGCLDKNKCSLEKHNYSAVYAQKEYANTLSESRTGFCISENEAIKLDEFLTPLIKNGQSIHHICVNHPDEIMFSEKSIYNYINETILTARNIDLPRKVRYRPRRSKHDSMKVDKKCRLGRTYEDFKKFIADHPDVPIVQIDSVEGQKGGKVLLTIHFVKSEFMLAFLRERNTAHSVYEVFENLYRLLGAETFKKLFPVILADNGSEFSDPESIEKDMLGNRRTGIFYCNPSAPYQKGSAENNHEFIRRILPKGTSFEELTQEKVELMMNHINSYTRANLGDKSPYEIFRMFYGQKVPDALGAVLIYPNDIILRPKLLN